MPLSTKLDFEMTSELEGILKREVQAPGHRHIHPSLPADSKIIDEYLVLYDPAMKLPEPDDENALVAWLGLNENVSKIVLDDYKERLAGNVEEEFPVLRESENPGATLVHNLAAVFHANIDQQWQWDEAEDFGMFSPQSSIHIHLADLCCGNRRICEFGLSYGSKAGICIVLWIASGEKL